MGKLSTAVKKSREKTPTTPPHLIVEARAGTGKTTTLVEGLKILKGIGSTLTPSPQQRDVWESIALSRDATTVGFCAFNKSIADELRRRIPVGCDAMTNHSMGNKAVKAAFPRVVTNADRCSNLISRIVGKDIRELRYRDPHFLSVTTKLVGLVKMNVADIDDCGGRLESDDADWPEILDRIVSHHDIEIDDKGKVYGVVTKVIEASRRVTEDGEIDFNDMIWLPITLNLPVPQFDLLLADEAQDLNRCQQELIKRAGRRLILCGDTHQCQPAGTLVTQTRQGSRWGSGETSQTPIECLRVGDHVTSWDRRYGNFVAKARVNAISVRRYKGPILTIGASEKTTRVTPNHRWTTRWATIATDLWCVYIMRRIVGRRADYRIGWCQMFDNSGNFHLAQRARLEGADAAWIISVHDDKSAATIQESYLGIRFQVPFAMFHSTNGATLYTDEWLSRFWKRIGSCLDLHRNAVRLLKWAGRDAEYPLYRKDARQKQGRGSIFETESCNLMQGLMEIPVSPEHPDSSETVDWQPLTRDTEDFDGDVYSLDVDKHHKYIADGLVTSNSIYGFAGADSESMPRMGRELGKTKAGCVTLPLTVTRRCGKAIVKEANSIVPDFSAHESNPPGIVSEATIDGKTSYRDGLRSGDMVISRTTAPLVSQCFHLLKEGRKATIVGRDIGQGLISTIKSSLGSSWESRSVTDLIYEIGVWRDKAIEKELAKKNPSDTKMITLNDRHDCILTFASACNSVPSVVSKIESLFQDQTQGEGVRFSTIHKAKGLEAKNVYLLQPVGAGVPHPMAKLKWEREQEMNLLYVAITRAIERLVYVYGELNDASRYDRPETQQE